MSRGGILALAVMLALLVWRFRGRREVVVMCVALVGLTLFMPQQFYDRISLLISGQDTTGTHRTEIWEVGLTMLKRYGIVGAGLNHFETIHERLVWGGPRFQASAPHNMYLSTWVDLGIVGLLLLIAFFASHLWQARRAVDAVGRPDLLVGAIRAAGLATLVAGFFLDIIWRKWFFLLWILLQWAVQVQSTARRRSAVRETPTDDPRGAASVDAITG